MKSLFQYSILFCLCLNTSAIAGLADENKNNYPILAKAVAQCIEEKGLIIQDINWTIINRNLRRHHSGFSDAWLEQIPCLSNTILWLLPDIIDWENIQTSHRAYYTEIIRLYEYRNFQRINTSVLSNLLNNHPGFHPFLDWLLVRDTNSPLTRFILTHLHHFQSQLSLADTNTLSVFQNTACALDWLIRAYQEKKISLELLINVICWLLSGTNHEPLDRIMSFIYNIVLSQPLIMSTLNNFTTDQIFCFLNYLVANPTLLTTPSEDEEEALFGQTQFLQTGIFYVQEQELSTQANQLNEALTESDPTLPDSPLTQSSEHSLEAMGQLLINAINDNAPDGNPSPPTPQSSQSDHQPENPPDFPASEAQSPLLPRGVQNDGNVIKIFFKSGTVPY